MGNFQSSLDWLFNIDSNIPEFFSSFNTSVQKASVMFTKQFSKPLQMASGKISQAWMKFSKTYEQGMRGSILWSDRLRDSVKKLKEKGGAFMEGFTEGAKDELTQLVEFGGGIIAGDKFFDTLQGFADDTGNAWQIANKMVQQGTGDLMKNLEFVKDSSRSAS